MLKVDNLSKDLDNFSLKNISFTLEEGFIMGLIGPNGAGKSTLIKMILNLLKTNKGTIDIFGTNYNENEIFIKDNIGFVLDEFNFYEDLKIKDYKKIMKGFYSNFDSDLFDRYLFKFKLDENKRIRKLSKGEKMKVTLANALSHKAKLLIFDEATAGLDYISRKELFKIFKEIIEDGDKSIIFSTHITSDLEGLADYITFINNGKIVFSKDIEDIKETYGLVRGDKETLDTMDVKFIGEKENKYYKEGLFIKEENKKTEGTILIPTLDEIMYYYIKGEEGC
ncbi:ABC transporter ATP-binding protein [Clostridium sp.]|uniref:ABC transporter ATP-binding protein n=1 Tax=Clostridium sp. TaxID=1506 RepID=UPI002617D1FC|nr:ABC transporter ATP-binding protein [Clostridium sp.]